MYIYTDLKLQINCRNSNVDKNEPYPGFSFKIQEPSFAKPSVAALSTKTSKLRYSSSVKRI